MGLTLDDAILHAQEKARGCDECAKEHAQLAEWLQKLKELKKRQEPKPVADKRAGEFCRFFCPECGRRFVILGANYCSMCGQTVKWDDNER